METAFEVRELPPSSGSKWTWAIISISLVLAIVSLFVDDNLAQITVYTPNEHFFWKGCILKKKKMYDQTSNLNDPCIKCAYDRDVRLLVRRKGWPQRMYNCTGYCTRVTVCTHARYYNGKDNGTYPICYHCQNKKNEQIIFRSLVKEQICSEDCQNCAVYKDLAGANECAKFCRGLPTFCYPKLLFMQHQVCYQANTWYGCDFVRVLNTTLTNQCQKCSAIARNPVQAQECSSDCDAIPTFSNFTRPANKNGTKIREYYHCQVEPNVVHGDLFLYELPRFLLKFFHANNPGNFYMSENVARSNFLAGSIAKIIFTPFNMTLLTFPRPRSFEDKGRF